MVSTGSEKTGVQMKCPTCAETTLVMAERQGVEIDYCPQCRGIWLDRGELDKLLDRAASPPSDMPRRSGEHDDHKDHDRYHDRHHHRRKSWLADIFD